MLQILGWTYDRYPTQVFYSCILALGLLLALSLRQRLIRPPLTPDVPAFLLRDPKGKLCFITNGFSSPEGLALIERLLGRGASVIVLCHPQDATDTRTLQLYALLKHNHPAGSTSIYIESVDLDSTEAIHKFAQTFESKGARVPGALGETVGRRSIFGLVCFQHPEHPKEKTLELARALLPTFEKSHKDDNPDPVLQRGGGPADAQTRVMAVLPSLRYTAASAQRLLYNPAANKLKWHSEAAHSLKLALLMQQAQARLVDAASASSDPTVLFLSVSTGVTRQRIGNAVSNASPLFYIALYPLIWFVGKSGTEAALGLEWALLHPHQSSAPTALDIPPSQLIQPGLLYRDGLNASLRLPEFSDEDLKAGLWRAEITEQVKS